MIQNNVKNHAQYGLMHAQIKFTSSILMFFYTSAVESFSLNIFSDNTDLI